MVYVDVDIDIWRHGKDASGKFNREVLMENYPYIRASSTFERDKINKILVEYFDLDHNGMRVFLTMHSYTFFQNKEDAEVCKGLLYIY